MWKLLEPKSTAARTSGTGRGAGRAGGLRSGERAVAAGGTGACASGGREGRAAAAGGARVWIPDHELGPLEPFAVVDLRTGEILHAHRIHDELDPQGLDAGVPVLERFVELKAVLQSRAATPLHEDAQHELRIAFATDEVADLAGGRVGEKERRCILQRFGGTH